jgi:predicted peroxiredoxin
MVTLYDTETFVNMTIMFLHHLYSRYRKTNQLMKIKPLFATISLPAILMGLGFIFATINVDAQSSTTQFQNATENTGAEKKSYFLVFGHRIVGNIDNSTKIVSSIVGENLVKIEEEFLEEISLAPSQQLEEQIDKIVNDGINGLPCNASLTTQQGENVTVECVSSGNKVIWYIYPTS